MPHQTAFLLFRHIPIFSTDRTKALLLATSDSFTADWFNSSFFENSESRFNSEGFNPGSSLITWPFLIEDSDRHTNREIHSLLVSPPIRWVPDPLLSPIYSLLVILVNRIPFTHRKEAGHTHTIYRGQIARCRCRRLTTQPEHRAAWRFHQHQRAQKEKIPECKFSLLPLLWINRSSCIGQL